MRNQLPRTTLVRALILLLATMTTAFASGPSAEGPPSTVETALQARRAIGEVYWNHRQWPASNDRSKPAYGEVVGEGELLKFWSGVETKRELLASRWGIETTGEMLQTELQRIAQGSQDPARLAELFAALDNEPRRIAEYLVQPVLVDRLIRAAFVTDSRIHQKTRDGIDYRWQMAESLAEFRAMAASDEIVRLARRSQRPGGSRDRDERRLSGEEWGDLVDALRTDMGVAQLRAGQVSPILENDRSFYRVAIERIDESSAILIQKTWPKQTLEGWLESMGSRDPATGDASASINPQSARADGSAVIDPPGGGYVLPELGESLTTSATCTDDTWRGPLRQHPSPRFAHTALWTGTEMIIWGGYHRGSFIYGDGGRYDPVTDSWSPVTTVGAPTPRGNHTAVWSGTEMLVWGSDEIGGRYNPATDSWTAMSIAGHPLSRDQHAAVWTGTEMIIWGGWEESGGRYDPATDSWATVSNLGAAQSVPESTAVWTGTEMIIWGGGEDPYDFYAEGARYDPASDTWVQLPFFPQVERVLHTAVWTGTEMIIWSGLGLEWDPELEEEIEVPVHTGAMYNPSTDSWTSIFGPNARYRHTAVWTGSEMIIFGGEYPPIAADSFDPVTESFTDLPFHSLVESRTEHTAVWTGNEMIVWGGVENSAPFKPVDTGVTWTPSAAGWTFPYASPAPEPRTGHTAVWTGSEMIIFGGRSAFGDYHTGSRYDPALNDWTSYSQTDVPTFREFHRAVWTGMEMIVWGGRLADWEDSGGRYNPATDSWTSTSTINAPAGRGNHAMAWSGTQMLVWGGNNSSTLGDGARYNPATDSWSAITATNAPSPRNGTSFVWTGSEAFVWGGSGTDDGRLYDPASDTWDTIAATGAPSARSGHTAVWTGSQVLVWGGSLSSTYLDTGAHYDPLADTWTPTPALDAPGSRGSHTAIWTGEEMIVWGGRLSSIDYDTGARYDPATMIWTPTTTTGALTGRYDHTAVWTGNEMLIWGGRIDNSFFNPDQGAYCGTSACTPLDWFRDSDSDGFGDSGDTLSACDQPAGYTSLAGDCNDADGAVYGRPGTTREMTLTHVTGTGITTIDWLAPTDLGGTAGSATYDLLRSPQASDFLTGTTCQESGSSTLTSTDATTPAAGSAFFYLSRAQNSCPSEGVGSLGNDSEGVERTGSVCP